MDIYHHIFEHTPDALLMVDPAGNIIDANGQAEAVFGFARADLIGRVLESLIPARFAAAHAAHRAEFARHPYTRRMGSQQKALMALRQDGSEFPAEIMISPLKTDEAMFTLCAVRDISERVKAEELLSRHTAELEALHAQLKILASRDGLTGLLNRATFREQVERLLHSTARSGESISVLLIDLDHFKLVNDQFGHSEGDRVLLAVAGALAGTCRQDDIAARYGGEEFVVALPDTDERGAMTVGENFRTAIANISGLRRDLTASVGIATYTPSGALRSSVAMFERLINDADTALYAAKAAGRNCVVHANDLASRP
ncbi:MAG: sensor domain-containing diguanylate cyclase [Usitatibacteraceae bacterium]